MCDSFESRRRSTDVVERDRQGQTPARKDAKLFGESVQRHSPSSAIRCPLRFSVIGSPPSGGRTIIRQLTAFVFVRPSSGTENSSSKTLMTTTLASSIGDPGEQL